jgi:maleate isomerase
MTGYAYDLTGPIGTKGTLGLIVLQVDETLEQDMRRMFPDPDTALYVNRIPSGDDLTPDTIATMEATLPHAAALLPKATAFDAVAYACTSGTTLIGAERVRALVSGACNTRQVCDPLSAALAALNVLGINRVSIVSPYIASVANPIRAAFEAAGHPVPATLSFGEEQEARVARIDPASIASAARDLAGRAETDAIFLSCTNLRTLDIIDPLEQELGMPVLSSNQVLAWALGRAIRGENAAKGPGALFHP